MKDEKNIIEALAKVGASMVTAESCTGGLIAHKITLIPGASVVFKGSVVAYSNEIKRTLLGVKEATLDTYGAVSEQTVRQMAEGARGRLNSDYALATSGIAGPGGASLQKPVGMVWFALASPLETFSQCVCFKGNRQEIIEQAAQKSFEILWEQLSK